MSKFSRLFFALTLFISLGACSDDDSSSNNSSASDLVGTWELTDFITSATTTTTVQGQTISSTINAEGSDYDYRITFTEDSFTTEGGYTYTFSGTSNGITIPPTQSSVENVMGSGTYSVNGNVMNVDGAFFEFDFQGMGQTGMSEQQMADFQINGNELIFTQNETIENTTNGITSTSTVSGNSTWTKL